jgi:DNA-binding GntR family transcriptional regulator
MIAMKHQAALPDDAAGAAKSRPADGIHSLPLPSTTPVPFVKSLREFIRDTLLDRIARGDLPPGQRVVEATLVREFAISATPVREAIRELVAMGVLEAQNNKGASVRQIRLRETIEAFEVRAALEALAGRGSAPSLRGQCSGLRRAADAIVASAQRRDFAAFQEHNQTFHRAIVEAAGNGVLLRTWDSLFFQVRTRFTMDYLESADPVAIAREHVPIVNALDRGDADRAAVLLASHSRHVVEFLRKEQHRRPGTGARPAPKAGSASASFPETRLPKPQTPPLPAK